MNWLLFGLNFHTNLKWNVNSSVVENKQNKFKIPLAPHVVNHTVYVISLFFNFYVSVRIFYIVDCFSGDTNVSCGEITINGHKVASGNARERLLAQQTTGYCPQFDALFNELTPLEHLLLYARLLSFFMLHSLFSECILFKIKFILSYFLGGGLKTFCQWLCIDTECCIPN